MLVRRLISAAIIIPVMLLLLYIDFWLGTDAMLGRPGLVLCFLAIITAAMAASELAQMFNHVACRINHHSVVGATIAMVGVTCLPVLFQDYPPDCPLGRLGFALSGVVLAMVIAFVIEMRSYHPVADSTQGEVIDRLGRYGLIFVYLIMMFGFLIPHRFLGNDNALGLVACITLITTVKMSDSFAYFVGKSFGTIKLSPNLSPGKTIQGSIGALVGGCVAAAIMVYLIAPFVFDITIHKPWWWVFAYGILVTCAGMVGDLAESLLKRDAQTKDSSRWLPGLGGVLDIIDSMVFASPISFFLWIVADTAAAGS